MRGPAGQGDDRTCLPTFSHFLIVNITSVSLARSLALSLSRARSLSLSLSLSLALSGARSNILISTTGRSHIQAARREAVALKRGLAGREENGRWQRRGEWARDMLTGLQRPDMERRGTRNVPLIGPDQALVQGPALGEGAHERWPLCAKLNLCMCVMYMSR